MSALFLLSLFLVAAIAGVPSVLFARVIRGAGLQSLASTLLGSAILPLIWIGFMTGERIAEVPAIPFLFPAVTFCAGGLVSLFYFRRHV